MHFLNGSEKILYLRKKARITQEDLATTNLSRGYIGLMENGRRNITEEASKVLTMQFKKVLAEKNYNLDIDDRYFLRTREEEAEKYCKEKLENDKITLEELDIIKDIAEEYNLDTYMSKAFMLIGDIYYNKNEYETAFENYFYSLDLISSDNKQNNIEKANIYNKLGVCKYKLLNYHEAIIYYNKAKDKSKEVKDEKIYYYAIYNLSICYKNIEKYEKAINEAQIFINQYWKSENSEDINNVIYAKGIQVSCYEAKGYIDYAINIIEDIISNNKSLDKKVLGHLYNNLAYLYFKNKKTEEAIFYYSEAQNIRFKHDRMLLGHTLIEKAQVYLDLNLYNEAIILLQLGIEYSHIYNDKQYAIEGYKFMKNIYKNLGVRNREKDIIKKIINLLENKILKIKYYNELSELCFKDEDYKNVQFCNTKIKELICDSQIS